MFRFSIALVVLVIAVPLHAQTCRVAGSTYDAAGHPIDSVVRLVDRQTRTTRFSASDAQAGFAFDNLIADESGQRYRIDMLSPPTVVTGSRIPVRSILGIASGFACAAGQTVRRDVRAQVD